MILRCRGRDTLRLVQSLGEDGFEVWVPAVTRRVNVPRMNAKRDVTVPLLPGFVFARSEHLWTLVERAEDTMLPITFSVFRYLDRYPVVRDAQLDPLRSEERRAVPKELGKVYARGSEVLVLPIATGAASAFAGMSGSVLRGNKRKTLILIGGSMRVELPNFDLQEVGCKAQRGSRISPGQAARAA